MTNSGLAFFGPQLDAEGGIATVLRNYRKMSFWVEFRCRHLPTMRDLPWTPAKLAYEFYRLAAAVVTLAVGPRPFAASVHSAHGTSFYRKLCYLLVIRCFRVPVVLHIHPATFADFYRTGGKLRRAAVQLASTLSDQVIFLSEDARKSLAKVFPLHKTHVLANPVDVAEFIDQPGQPCRSDAHVLFLGWIIREKGVYDLVDAMPEVLRHYPHARFTFGGNKEVETLRALLVSRGLATVAEVPGWVDEERRLALLKTATVLVLPSYAEGLPNVILEAMASGLPIVTTPVGAIPSVLTDGETALFVRPRDSAGIASAILALLRGNDLRNRIARAALRTVRQRYSLEVVGSELTRIYARYRDPVATSAGAPDLPREDPPRSVSPR